jgi:hypothetical protein
MDSCIDPAVEPEAKYTLLVRAPTQGDSMSCPSPPTITWVGGALPGAAVAVGCGAGVDDGCGTGVEDAAVEVACPACVEVAGAVPLTTMLTHAWCGKKRPEALAICQKLV